MSKKVFQKRFQRECEAMIEYQQGESRYIQKEAESVISAKDVPLNAVSPVSTCGNQLEGATSVSVLDPETLNSGQFDTSKFVDCRDTQNTFEKLIRVEGYLPGCESHSLSLNVALSGSSREQTTSEEPLLDNMKVSLVSIKATNAIAGTSQMQLRKDTVKRKFICEFCSKEYKNKSQLRQHYLRHTGERRFACKLCGKRFTHKQKLTQHNRLHTGQKPFKCDICKKGFTQIGSLDKHSRTHSGEKPYNCDVCGKEFSHKANRDVHRRIHTGQKPFKCDICKKDFTQKVHLHLHSRTHSSLNNHLRKHW